MCEFASSLKHSLSLLLGGLVLAGLWAAVNPASAGRPGTPNNEKAYDCRNWLAYTPSICFEFYNTASEAVNFDIEMTVNGSKAVAGRRPNAGCMPEQQHNERTSTCTVGCTNTNPGGYHGPLYRCEAASNFNNDASHAAVAKGRTRVDHDGAGAPILPQGLMLKDLAYNTTYCFRLKARRRSDSMVSERWSNWACAKTREAPPPKPAKPQYVTTEYVPPGRQKNWRIEPPKVTIKWGGVQNAAGYTVMKQGVILKTVDRSARLEYVDYPTEKDVASNVRSPSILYGICAFNISGKACTDKSTHVPLYGTIEKPKIPSGDLTKIAPPAIKSEKNIPGVNVTKPPSPAIKSEKNIPGVNVAKPSSPPVGITNKPRIDVLRH